MADYGTVEGVEALATTYTENGVFVDPDPVYDVEGSNPPLTTVIDWLDSVSAFMNMALMEEYFIPPVELSVSPNSYKAISEYVNSLVADLVAARNSHGRFFTDAAQNSPMTRFAQIQKDLKEWVAQHADALAADNVPQRSRSSIKEQPFLYVLGKH